MTSGRLDALARELADVLDEMMPLKFRIRAQDALLPAPSPARTPADGRHLPVLRRRLRPASHRRLPIPAARRPIEERPMTTDQPTTFADAERLLRAAADATQDHDQRTELLAAVDAHAAAGCPAGDLAECVFVQRARAVLATTGEASR